LIIDIGSHASHQPSHGVAVKVAHRQSLEMAEDLGTHVVHGLLSDALHDAYLNVLCEKIADQNQKPDPGNDEQAMLCLRDREGLVRGRD
jgi:hypothetical protein